MFAALTAGDTSQHKHSMAIRGTLIAAIILVAFALVGEILLASLGISLPALRAAGGILLLTFIALLIAGRIQHFLGVIGMQVITRVMGVLLSALAVQFIFDGISQSGLLGV